MGSIFSGENIYLRELTAEDANVFFDKNGEPNTDIMQKYDVVDFPYSVRTLKSMIEKGAEASKDRDDFTFAIVKKTGTVIGVITAFDCDMRMGTFKYGQFILSEFQGKGYGKEAAQILLNYYFNERRYHKVNVYIYSFNDISVKFHEKIGFKKEGQLKDMVYTNGRYYDIIFLGMTDAEFNLSK